MILALASVDAQGFDIQKLLKNNGATNSNNGGPNSILNSLAGSIGGSQNPKVPNKFGKLRLDSFGIPKNCVGQPSGFLLPLREPQRVLQGSQGIPTCSKLIFWDQF